MANPQVLEEIKTIHEGMIQAVSENRLGDLNSLLARQNNTVLSNKDLLDASTKQEIQATLERCLLLANLSRAHCLDKILINQRKLAVLSAYQGR